MEVNFKQSHRPYSNPTSERNPVGTQTTSKVNLTNTGGGSNFPKFRQSIDTLNAWSVRFLMEHLEHQEGKGIENNGRYGTMGLTKLANLSVSDPAWDQSREPILKHHRQMVVDAAKEALSPQNQNLLSQIHGGDGVFEKDDMANWITANPLPKNQTLPGFNKFYDALKTLTKTTKIMTNDTSEHIPAALIAMDDLEAEAGKGRKDHITDRTSLFPRFGTSGLVMLSKITPDHGVWKKIGMESIPRHERQQFIDAAKTAWANQPLLFQVHNGDGIFEHNNKGVNIGWEGRRHGNDMTNWLKLYESQRSYMG
jgi:hypothetical protein